MTKQIIITLSIEGDDVTDQREVEAFSIAQKARFVGYDVDLHIGKKEEIEETIEEYDEEEQ